MGVILVNLDNDDDDFNFCFLSDINLWVIESKIFCFGGEWIGDKWFVSVEVVLFFLDIIILSFNIMLNFINFNVFIDVGGVNDNSVFFEYDLMGGLLVFGIVFGVDYVFIMV